MGAAALLVALAGTLLWLALLMGPYRLAGGLVDSANHLEQAEANLSAGKFGAGRYEVLAATAAARRAKDGLGASGPLLDIASVIPKVEAAAEALPHLVGAARHSASAAQGSFEITQNAVEGPNAIIARDSSDPNSELRVRIDRVQETAAVIDRVRAEVQQARGELESIDLDSLPRQVGTRVNQGIRRANKADALLADAQAGFAILPSILGADGPRTYLFGMQNPAELRGTGGALLRYAELTITNGQAELRKPRTVYKVDINRKQVTVPLPEDAWYVAGIDDAQRFGNANWSPDWPLSARLTIRYGRKTAAAKKSSWPERVDGLIAVDPLAMQELLQGVGAYTTEGGRPITSRKVLHFLLYKAYAHFPLTGERRTILNEVVDRFYSKMLKPKRPSELVRSAGDVLTEKDIQIWLADPAEQRFIERMNWDGAIDPARHDDYLYVVQQNVGGNKLNYFEDQVHTFNIKLSGKNALVSSEVRIFNGVLQPVPRYVLGDSNGFHRPMINLYVPKNASLRSWHAPEVCRDLRELRPCRLDAPKPAAWSGGTPAEHTERGKKVWSATVQIPPRRSGAVSFDYQVPGVVRTVGERKVYRLMIQRQPKVRPEEVIINLELPTGATDVEAPGWKRHRNRLVWKRFLRSDADIQVSWRE